jgi:hypothetical protein
MSPKMLSSSFLDDLDLEREWYLARPGMDPSLPNVDQVVVQNNIHPS